MAKKDIVHGLKSLEEIAESWPCAHRTLRILDILARKWNVDLPNEARIILKRTHAKFGSWGSWDQVEPSSHTENASIPRSPQDPPVTSADYPIPDPMSGPAEPANSQVTSVMSSSTSFPQYQSNTPPILAPHQLDFMQSTQPTTSAASQHTVQTIHGHTGVDLEPNGWMKPAGVVPTCGDSNTAVSTQSPFLLDAPGNTADQNQEWWLKDQNSLAFGLENWPESWDAVTTTPASADIVSSASDGGVSGNNTLGDDRSLLFESRIPSYGNIAVTGIATNDGHVFNNTGRRDLSSNTTLNDAGNDFDLGIPVSLPDYTNNYNKSRIYRYTSY